MFCEWPSFFRLRDAILSASLCIMDYIVCSPSGTHLMVTVIYSVWAQVTLQYIPRNMHTVFALLCFVVVIHWLIYPYPSGLFHCHCGNLTIAPVPAKQPWWIWINTSCEFIMDDCITTTKQSTTKPCAYFLGYTVYVQCSGSLTIWIFRELHISAYYVGIPRVVC